MKTSLGHIQINVGADNLVFYRNLMTLLGWQPVFEGDGMFGASDGNLSLWFGAYANDNPNDYDGAGMNHIGIHTASLADVDTVVEYLAEAGIATLFDTPRHRPDFSDESSTYYQVMFESPDRLLFEIVYIGPLA